MATVRRPFDLLLPRPHRLEPADDWVLPARPALPPSRPGLSAAVARLAAAFARAGVEPAHGEPADVRFHLRNDACLGAEGYRLEVNGGGVDVAAATPAGLFYGAATLAQWIELHRPDGGGAPARIGGLSVDDRPDFAARGVMLDVSRDKVPRPETLRALVDLLAGLKVNQLQLYTEHTFAYRGHETVWRDASPLTPEDVRDLDAFCAERFVELVPNQQSFGHFHRWLVHPEYRALAECPEGIEHPFSLAVEPFSLCPLDPGTLDLLDDLYGQLLPRFTSRQVNVGLDETIDLGRCRSRAACEERGRGRVYLDFLRRVHGLLAARGRRMQFWGDVVLQHPELLAELPADAVALEWGYEADHPFAADAARFAASGLDFFVCPGTSGWNSFAGRATNALGNLASAAVHGRAHGAAGYLVTDWGDYGHLQPLTASYLGLAAGAAFAWNAATAETPLAPPWAELLDRHVLRDRAGAAGRVVTGLGEAYLHAGRTPRNGSALFFLVVFALLERERRLVQGVTEGTLAATLEHVGTAASGLGGLRLERDDAAVVERELAWTADVLAFACRFGRRRLASGDLGSFDAIPRRDRRALARELRTLAERHREISLERYRPGGLEASAGWLTRVADLLASA
jgi:hypothetical protein